VPPTVVVLALPGAIRQQVGPQMVIVPRTALYNIKREPSEDQRS
jgi:hypothetical protein